MQTVAPSVPSGHARSVVSPGALRLWHSYASAFVAPMLLFFAISGTLQIFGFQDPHDGHAPNGLIAAMAKIHKDQVTGAALTRRREPPGEPGAAERRPGGSGGAAAAGGAQGGPQGDDRAPSLATRLLKALFALEALTLVVTTLLGVWVGATHPKRARTFWLVFAAGTLLPAALIVA